MFASNSLPLKELPGLGGQAHRMGNKPRPMVHGARSKTIWRAVYWTPSPRKCIRQPDAGLDNR